MSINNTEFLNRALNFVKLHENDSDEKQQGQMWIRDFLEVFNIAPEKINIGFEWRVNIDGSQKYADHLLNGVVLIEMKSKGKKLDKAKSQAFRYVMNLEEEDIPKYIVLSNFERIQIIDLLDMNNTYDILSKDLPKHLDKFNFLLNKVQDVHIPSNPVNAKAARMMESLHNEVLEMNYRRNYADLLMTRIVFCLFAEDSGIFNTNQFSNFIKNETKSDGSDLVDKLASLFQALNTPEEERFQVGALSEFPYVNGGLFERPQLIGLELNTNIRNTLIETSSLDWSKISPVIFGSMFEGAMDKEKRHSVGAHYTSEINILKVIDGLFMNELRAEFDSIVKLKNINTKNNRLENFHDKLADLKFLDPACGSGNFLMVAYRELRRLEHEVIDEIHQGQTLLFDISELIKVEINQFYGIEILPYAISVSKIGLWLVDHLMNLEASQLFGKMYLRLPLHPSANITEGDALSIDWEEVIEPDELDYIFGNPPFIGSRLMDKSQKSSLLKVAEIKGARNLDYVAGWFFKSTYMMLNNPKIKASFVSTNSLYQGTQANLLWMKLFELGVKINFAHQTFKWDNKGAIVHVAISGFSMNSEMNKFIAIYDDDLTTLKVKKVDFINEYLVDGPVANIKRQSKQISEMSTMYYGVMPIDNGNYVLSQSEYRSLIDSHPELEKYTYKYIGSKEFLRSETRYILYLKNAPVKLLQKNKELINRIQNVQQYRSESTNPSTIELAKTPLEFHFDKISDTKKLLIPRVSSSRREYLPIGYVDEDTIVSDSAFQLIDDDLYVFGILQSQMHTLWLKTVAGRLKNDIRYSNAIVYNTFVFPTTSEYHKNEIRNCASEVLQMREELLENNSISDIYDPLFMNIKLRKVHLKLDQAVESAYNKVPFKSDNDRIAHLIKLYKKESD